MSAGRRGGLQVVRSDGGGAGGGKSASSSSRPRPCSSWPVGKFELADGIRNVGRPRTTRHNLWYLLEAILNNVRVGIDEFIESRWAASEAVEDLIRDYGGHCRSGARVGAAAAIIAKFPQYPHRGSPVAAVTRAGAVEQGPCGLGREGVPVSRHRTPW